MPAPKPKTKTAQEQQKDWATLLGVTPTATEEEIRKSFKQKAKTAHPDKDKTPGAEERLKELNAAYQGLLDARAAEAAANPLEKLKKQAQELQEEIAKLEALKKAQQPQDAQGLAKREKEINAAEKSVKEKFKKIGKDALGMGIGLVFVAAMMSGPVGIVGLLAVIGLIIGVAKGIKAIQDRWNKPKTTLPAIKSAELSDDTVTATLPKSRAVGWLGKPREPAPSGAVEPPTVSASVPRPATR